MYYGENFVEESISRCAARELQTQQFKNALEQQQAAEREAFEQLMKEARMRQIEMYRRMKAKCPNNSAVQELCDKQLARLEKEEETGA